MSSDRHAGKLTRQTKKRFGTIRLRVAGAHEGIYPKVRSFVRSFWQELH
ncbi:hypothetical protein [Spirosoma luteum]|nr:hypothetical protein [Spirosoma luteum]